MTAGHLRRWALIILASLGGVACQGTGEPQRGTVAVTVDSPNGPEGAAVLEAETEDILGVTAQQNAIFYRGGGGVTRIVLVRTQPGVLALWLEVADIRQMPHVYLLQVADGANQERGDLSGYVVHVQRVDGS